MGFDKESTGPVVNVQKRTTKVNFWIVGLVLLFLVAGGLYMAWVHAHSGQVTETVHEQATKP